MTLENKNSTVQGHTYCGFVWVSRNVPWLDNYVLRVTSDGEKVVQVLLTKEELAEFAKLCSELAA